MTGILQGELGKTLSTRTLAAFVLVCIGFGALNAVIIGAASGELDTLAEKNEALTCLPVLLVVWGLVGVAGEYRHRTAAPAALAAPASRTTVLGLRILAYTVTGLVLGVLTSAVSVAIALPLTQDMPGEQLTPDSIGKVVAANIAASVLATVLGAAVGALIRNQVAGVVTVLVLDFAVAPLLANADEGLANLTPSGAASVLSGMTHNTTLSVFQAGLVLAGWTAVGVLAALLSEGRRDLA
jgi:ABC-2 type transport system permease protein